MFPGGVYVGKHTARKGNVRAMGPCADRSAISQLSEPSEAGLRVHQVIGFCLEILNIRPISANWMMRAVPP